jgi:hypothetical protein
MKELVRVRVQYATRQQCCKTHKRPFTFVLDSITESHIRAHSEWSINAKLKWISEKRGGSMLATYIWLRTKKRGLLWKLIFEFYEMWIANLMLASPACLWPMQLMSQVKVPTNWQMNLLNNSHVRRKVLYKSTIATLFIVFIVAPCILITLKFLSPTNTPLY